MLLKTLLILLSVSLIGCSSLPPFPDLSLCVIDVERNKLICKKINSDEFVDVPIDQADNYLAMSPRDFESLQLYIEDLKTLAKKKCKR